MNYNQPDPNQPPQQPYGQPGPGQQPYGTPPPQQQYPQQPMQQPPPKKKRRRTGCIIAIAIVAVIVIIAIAANSGGKSTTTTTGSTPQATVAPGSPTPTPKPTVAPTWQTVHTYTGNGSKKTETIAVPGDWKILWTCDPASFNNIQYNVIVQVTNSDGTPADLGAINTLCKTGNVSGDTEERQAGNIFLDVTSEGAWTLNIQVLK